MVSKTPEFWYTPSKSAYIISALLSPLSSVYQIGHKLNIATKQEYNAPIPVICVGNATAGGSGKTPTAIAISKLIKEYNLSKTPYFLTRGYGGNETGPRVISVHDDANDVGDEPLLLKNHSKTIVSKDRIEGAKKAHELYATCIIMDDGLQNPTLAKDISFLVINGKSGFGNQKTIPAGPLREPLKAAFKRCDAIIIIDHDEYGIKQLCPDNIPIFHASITPQTDHLRTKQKYIAFAGLGQPEKFLNTLNSLDMSINSFHPYPDHYKYTNTDIEDLIDKAKKSKSTLITTEKDHVRIPERYRKNILTLPISLSWQNEDKIVSFLKKHLTSFKHNPHEAS